MSLLQFLKKAGQAVKNRLREAEWRHFKKKRKSRLNNTDFTIIASNCNGSFMYYDMGLRYLTPTVNLAMSMDDFVKMAENLRWYMEQPIVPAEEQKGCPAGILGGDVRIEFVHYKTFEEGVRKWEERKKRINWENLFLVGTEKDGCTRETIRRFEKLPYPNKVLFTRVEYPDCPSTYCIRGFEKEQELGVLTFYKKQLRKRRYLDDFDYVAFLNGGRSGQTEGGGS